MEVEDTDLCDWETEDAEHVEQDLLGQESDLLDVEIPQLTGKSVSSGDEPGSQSLITRIGVSVNDKAGLENVDAAKANQLIYEMSKVRKSY